MATLDFAFRMASQLWGSDFLPRRMVLASAALGMTVCAGTLTAFAFGIILIQWSVLLILALGPVWLAPRLVRRGAHTAPATEAMTGQA